MHVSSEILRNLRKEKGLTQSTVANYLNVDRSNYSKYELGKLEMNLDMVVNAAKFFCVSTDYLLGVSTVRKRVDDIKKF